MYLNLRSYSVIKIYLFYLIFLLFSNKYKIFLKFIVNNKNSSKSQIFQDLFVYFFSNYKKKGTFIEIGGGDGSYLSNTYILEKKFGWKGIICEPDNRFHSKIRAKRKCFLEKKPIHKISNKKIYFLLKNGYDSHISTKYNSSTKITTSLSLNSLIAKYQLGKNIDYISIDTEGNELDILKSFNFNRYNVKIFTIEHNFQKRNRENIYKILNKNGYKRMFKYISFMDDWYIKKI